MPRSNPRTDPERVHERGADPAEHANRPLEPKRRSDDLAASDDVVPVQRSPYHALNTPVGEVHPDADSDPYAVPGVDDEAEHASGTTGAGQGAEDD